MQLHVNPKTKAVLITEDTRLYLEKKLNKLGKHFRREPEVHVIQGFERGLHIVEITLNNDGMLLRGQERHSDLHAAIDGVVEKLETQWKRFKGKRVDGHRHPSPLKAEAEAIAEAENTSVFAPRIVRRKTFPMKSMPPEEAARQMELLGHTFFVFLDEETSRLGILYKRDSGDYGLIEPEV